MFRILIQTVTFIAASSTFSAGVMTAAFYIVPSSIRADAPHVPDSSRLPVTPSDAVNAQSALAR